MSTAQRLRELLAEPSIAVMPGCFDALSAKLVAAAGFKVTFMSGFAVSAARLGVPDTGLISFGEMLDSVRNCCAAAAQIPLIGDGDTGYGQCPERAAHRRRICPCRRRRGGDRGPGQPQKMRPYPRQAGDLARRSAHEDAAAADAKSDADILIMARTDARAVDGFDAALDDCRDFEDAGADIIFLEAPETQDEMSRFCQAMHKPCMANMVPGGKTPVLPPVALQAIGSTARALSGDAVVGRGRRHAVDARRAQFRRRRAASAERVVRRIAKRRRFPDYWRREERYKVQGVRTPCGRRVLIRSRRRAAGSRSSTTSTDNPAPRPCRRRCAAFRRAHAADGGVAFADELPVAMGCAEPPRPRRCGADGRSGRACGRRRRPRYRQLVGEVEGVLDAAIHAHAAERIVDMRGVAGEQRPAVAEAVATLWCT